ncbi:CNT_collapsed_G0015700.mRNA.1.CDS.1 [Saccharomyces cerevisiae]|nr:CNT_collapsed_G0015700.mRNA.1.CDS.1 [Saccharomyces cerevisiae]
MTSQLRTFHRASLQLHANDSKLLQDTPRLKSTYVIIPARGHEVAFQRKNEKQESKGYATLLDILDYSKYEPKHRSNILIWLLYIHLETNLSQEEVEEIRVRFFNGLEDGAPAGKFIFAGQHQQKQKKKSPPLLSLTKRFKSNTIENTIVRYGKQGRTSYISLDLNKHVSENGKTRGVSADLKKSQVPNRLKDRGIGLIKIFNEFEDILAVSAWDSR